MAADSLFCNIIIDTKEKGKVFEKGWLEAEKYAEKHPFIPIKTKKLEGKELESFFERIAK